MSTCTELFEDLARIDIFGKLRSHVKPMPGEILGLVESNYLRRWSDLLGRHMSYDFHHLEGYFIFMITSCM